MPQDRPPRSSRTPFFQGLLPVVTILLVTLGSLPAASPAAGQEAADEPALETPASEDVKPRIDAQASFRFIGAVPQGGLRDNISLGGGLQGFIGGWLGQGPLMLGLDVAFLGYGSTTDQVPFSSTVGPRVPVEVSTSNNVLETHLSARLQRRRGRFRPYAEGLVGFKYLFTQTRIGDDGFGDDFGDDFGDEVASSTNYDDFALSAGAGAGVDVRVFQREKPAKTVQAVSLRLGVQYLLGTEAEYLAEGELADENGNGRLDEDELDVRRSRTTFLQPQFGVTLRLGGTD
ncbi:hypothetical protein GGP50_002584 [Salinibacter ruber]|uniref:hypothetical protein n=1 Tax=Salinibacter ruber TaxID=146919 RepID=UPI0021676685|nr:hypothetical protein [Salinibacter ruber]MCS4194358.1 hypothetical protein [Salinibacter ruber]